MQKILDLDAQISRIAENSNSFRIFLDVDKIQQMKGMAELHWTFKINYDMIMKLQHPIKNIKNWSSIDSFIHSINFLEIKS